MIRLRSLRKRGHQTLLLMVLAGILGFVQSYADEDKSRPENQKAGAESADSDESKTEKSKRPEKRKRGGKKKLPSKQPAKVVALVGGRILTMGAAGVIDSGTVVITDDVISAIGKSVKIPDGTTIIDVAGMTVSPGLIDCRSSLWLARDSVSASASDGSLRAIDAVDPFSDSWIEVARQGVTAVSIQPSGSLGGQSAVLRVASAESVKSLVISKASAVQASLGLSGSTGNSRDRFLQYESLKKKLTAAKTYKEEWEKYEEAVKKAAEKPVDKKAESDKPAAEKKPVESPAASRTRRPVPGGRSGFGGGRGGVRGPGGSRGRPPVESSKPAEADTKKEAEKTEDKKADVPKKPKRDPSKDLLVRVLNKEIPLRLEAHRADDVANSLKLAKDFDLTFVMEGLSSAGRSWEQLKQQHPPLVVGPFIQFESKPSYASNDDDRYDHLSDVDGLRAIGSFSKDSRGSRLIRFHAAAAVSAGLNQNSALKAITIDAAKILGVGDKIGSLEVGKHADICVTAGHPVNAGSPVVMTMSNGEVVFKAAESFELSNDDAIADVPYIEGRLPEEFALVSDRVLYPDGKIAAGAVLVKQGVIAAVAQGKTETDGLPVVDVGNAVVSPGLIVGHVAEVDVSSTDAVATQIRAIDSFSPESKSLRDLSEGGFTSVMYSPDSRSVVSGQIGCVRIHAKQQILANKNQPVLPAAKFVLASAARSSERYPASLSGQLTLLSKYFSGESVASNLYIPTTVRKLMVAQHEKLLGSLKNKATLAVMEAGTSPEVEAALAIIREHHLNAVILHPEDLHASIDGLQETGTGIVVRSAKITDHDWYAKDIANASKLGVKISLSGDDPTKLRQTMALLVNAGMSPAAALRSITSDTAAAFGLQQVGTLTAGAIADIVIWDGSPINPAARPLHVIVDGRIAKDSQ